MRIGLVADSHDNCDAARAAVTRMKSLGVARILHAGDIVAPFTARIFSGSGVPVDAVLGNNDGETTLLAEVLPGITREFRALEVAGRKVLLVHERERIPDAEAATADLVVHGHTHRAERVDAGARLEVNPGECGGWLTGRRSFAVWEPVAGSIDIIEF